MRIHLVCYEDYDAWILGKFARRLCQELASAGMDVSLGKSADPSADINHHIIYYDYCDRAATIETVMITHINDERELAKVRKQLDELDVDMGICMSFETVHRLAQFGIPRGKLCFVSPAHDGIMRARPTLIGITTRLYPDGCKREHLLEELATSLSPTDFSFVIMGARWERVVGNLRAQGFDIRYIDHFDAMVYREILPSIDYYLYLGQDEGSMGFLDALAAGVPTIVTPQGFHLDVPGGITHAVETIQDLRAVFGEIAERKHARVRSVAEFTWTEHARRHMVIWTYLYRRKAGRSIPPELARELGDLSVITNSRLQGAWPPSRG